MSEVFNLKKFQDEMYSFISNPEIEFDKVMGVGKTPHTEQAMELYRGGLVARLTEALGEVQECLWFILGDEAFFELAREYTVKYPSTFYNLTEYGRFFPEFIRKHNMCSDQKWLGDLASLNLLMSDIFHSKDELTINNDKLALIQENPNSKIIFNSSFKLIRFEYRVSEIWKTWDDEDFELKKIQEGEPEYLACYKSSNQSGVTPFNEIQFELLTLLSNAVSVEESIDKLSDLLGPRDVTEIFQFLGQSGVIIDIVGI